MAPTFRAYVPAAALLACLVIGGCTGGAEPEGSVPAEVADSAVVAAAADSVVVAALARAIEAHTASTQEDTTSTGSGAVLGEAGGAARDYSVRIF